MTYVGVSRDNTTLHGCSDTKMLKRAFPTPLYLYINGPNYLKVHIVVSSDNSTSPPYTSLHPFTCEGFLSSADNTIVRVWHKTANLCPFQLIPKEETRPLEPTVRCPFPKEIPIKILTLTFTQFHLCKAHYVIRHNNNCINIGGAPADFIHCVRLQHYKQHELRRSSICVCGNVVRTLRCKSSTSTNRRRSTTTNDSPKKNCFPSAPPSS